LVKASVVSPGIGSAYFGKYFTPYGELKHSYMEGGWEREKGRRDGEIWAGERKERE
jgi:hypothetical protein